MTTWREATAAKRERQGREGRYFTPDLVSDKRCTDCALRLPFLLSEAGYNTHPTCGPESARIMAAAR